MIPMVSSQLRFSAVAGTLRALMEEHGRIQSWRQLSAHRRGAWNLVSAAAFPWTMLRNCSVSHAGPSTTGFARVDCRPFARSAGRSAFCLTRSRRHATAGPLSEARNFSGRRLAHEDALRILFETARIDVRSADCGDVR